MFYRANVGETDDCRSPAIPDDLGFLVVVYGSDFVIFETGYLEGELPAGVEKIHPELNRLLASGEAYPPARALAMEYCENSELDYYSLCERLKDLLLERCAGQFSDGFRFLQATGDHVGYMNRSQFYWVLGYLGERVYWVSSDYQIYCSPCSNFGLVPSELAGLFPNSWRRATRNRTPAES